MSKRTFFGRLAVTAVALAYGAVLLLPILWGTLLSFKTRVDALSSPPKWFFMPTLSNYHKVFLEEAYGRTIINSIFIASASSAIAMALAVPAAYVYSRSVFQGKEATFLGILSIRMAPATVIALPLFLIFTKLDFIDSYLAIILVHSAINISLAVWVLKGFFDEIPMAIDEAALLDGDSRFTALGRHVLPLSLPGIFVTAIFCFVNSWNEFFLALILTGYDTRPFTVAVPALVTPHGTYWGQVAAIATVGLIPGCLFALVARKYLVQEMTAGAIWR